MLHVIAAVALAVLFLVSGVLHFLLPGYFRSLIPPWLRRGAAGLVAASGVADLVAGVSLLLPGARAGGAVLAAGLVCVYLVPHVDALLRASGSGRLLERPVGAAARVGVNVAYLAWALAVAYSAP